MNEKLLIIEQNAIEDAQQLNDSIHVVSRPIMHLSIDSINETFENPLHTDCMEEQKKLIENQAAILVVDDDMTNIMVMTSLLEDCG